MSRIFLTLAAAAIASACGLVIDPDKLTEGNGTTETPSDASDGDASDGGGD
jgi:hypothetical protein